MIELLGILSLLSISVAVLVVLRLDGVEDIKGKLQKFVSGIAD